MSHTRRIAELETSHRELRAAVMLAHRRIRKIAKQDRSLAGLREVLRRARIIAKRKPGDPVLIRRAS